MGEQGDVEVEDEDVWHAEQDGDLLVADIETGGVYEKETDPAGVSGAGLHGTALPH